MAPFSGVGLGLRWDFLEDLVARIEAGTEPDLPFFEVTPENHMRRDGFIVAALDRVAARYPFISHGLSLSLGGTDPFRPSFLRELGRFLARYESPFHSDHLCFSGKDDRAIPDLLPLPLSRAAARVAASRVREASDRLECPVAIENISYYVSPGAPEMSEVDFLRRVLEEADCGLLLDVNNVHVNSLNFGFDAWRFIDALPLERVVEIHVAGYVENEDRGLFIDTHGADIVPPVHDLLRRTIARTGPVPVVLERDNDVPDLDQLLGELAVVRGHYEAGLKEHAAAQPPSPSGSRDRVPEIWTSAPAPDSMSPESLDRLHSLQRAVQRLATMGDPPEDRPGAFVAWGVHPEDAHALSVYPSKRLGVYGGLVAGTVVNAAKNQLAMTCARLSEESLRAQSVPMGPRAAPNPSALRALVQRFLSEDPPRSPYLRDVPFEFAIWAAAQWKDDPEVPAYLPDLARYELLLFATGTTERGPRPEHTAPLAADRGIWLDGAVHLARFRHAVHLLPENEGDLSVPERRDVALLCYRDAEDEVRKLELTLPAMEILERLFHGAPLARALEGAARALGRPVDASLIEGISTVLADLSERGALWGPAPSDSPLPDRAERSPYYRWLVSGSADRPGSPSV